MWTEAFEFKVVNEKTIEFVVYDDDPGTDDIIGQGSIDLRQIRERKNFEDWVEIKCNNQKAGDIKFNIYFGQVGS